MIKKVFSISIYMIFDLYTHFVHVQFVQYLSSPSRIKSKSKAASYRR